MTAYFYETDTGMFDLQHGFGKGATQNHASLQDAMTELRVRLQAEHTLDGAWVSLDRPVEVSWDEVQLARISHG